MAVVESTDASDLGVNVGSTSRNLDAGVAAEPHAVKELAVMRMVDPTGGVHQIPALRPHQDPAAASFHMKVQQFRSPVAAVERSNGGGGRNGEEGFKQEMRDLEELLSKLNPMAEEFVPSNHALGLGGGVGGQGVYSNSFGMHDGFPDGGMNDGMNGGMHGNGGRRRKNGYGLGKRRMNTRTSMAQRDEIIRRTVYVSDIDQQVTEEELATLFVNCGQVVDCRVCGDPNSVLRFAFIEFTDEEGARAALSLSGTMLGFYPVKVLPSKTAIAPVDPKFLPRSEDEREMCTRTIYCTNIDKKVTQADVKLFFESICGPVYRLRLLGDYHHSTRIAFVEFVRAESAIAALNCSGAILGSLPLRVSPSKTPVRPRSPRPPVL